MFRDVPECSGMFHVPRFIEANIHKLCVKNLTIFKFEPTTSNRSQHIATRRNMVVKRAQHVAIC